MLRVRCKGKTGNPHNSPLHVHNVVYFNLLLIIKATWAFSTQQTLTVVADEYKEELQQSTPFTDLQLYQCSGSKNYWKLC